MGNILDIAVEYAEKNNAKIINKINLKIGIMSDIIPEWAQTYFELVGKDTIAEKAILVVEPVYVVMQCHACNHEFGFEKAIEIQYFCPKCKSTDIELLQGRELQISSIEVD
jgi:hydrogenase nickel incorporation protein HypA/HybF